MEAHHYPPCGKICYPTKLAAQQALPPPGAERRGTHIYRCRRHQQQCWHVTAKRRAKGRKKEL